MKGFDASCPGNKKQRCGSVHSETLGNTYKIEMSMYIPTCCTYNAFVTGEKFSDIFDYNEISNCTNMTSIKQSNHTVLLKNTFNALSTVLKDYDYSGIIYKTLFQNFKEYVRLGVGGENGTICMCGTEQDLCSMEKGTDYNVSCLCPNLPMYFVRRCVKFLAIWEKTLVAYFLTCTH